MNELVTKSIAPDIAQVFGFKLTKPIVRLLEAMLQSPLFLSQNFRKKYIGALQELNNSKIILNAQNKLMVKNN